MGFLSSPEEKASCLSSCPAPAQFCSRAATQATKASRWVSPSGARRRHICPIVVKQGFAHCPRPGELMLTSKLPGRRREIGSAETERRGRSPSPLLPTRAPWATFVWGSWHTWNPVSHACSRRPTRTSRWWLRTQWPAAPLRLAGHRTWSSREAAVTTLWLCLITRLGPQRTWASALATSSKSWTLPRRAGGSPGTWRKGEIALANCCRAIFRLTMWPRTGACRQSRE